MEKERRLAAYDAVPQDGAESLVRFWRAHPQTGEQRKQGGVKPSRKHYRVFIDLRPDFLQS